MKKTLVPAWIALLLLSAAACGLGPEQDDVCLLAISHVAQCTGELKEYPAEGCVPTHAEMAERVLSLDCAALNTAAGKADSWCSGWADWLVPDIICEPDMPVAEAVAIATLDDVCPRDRGDGVCDHMRGARKQREEADAVARYAEALSELRKELTVRTPADAYKDPAVRFYVRERVLSLLAWNVVMHRLQQEHAQAGQELDLSVRPDGYQQLAAGVLEEYFPHYDAERFHMALQWMPPAQDATCEPQILLMFPGVVRAVDRQEFREQAELIEQNLPCMNTVHVNSGTFVSPSLNAEQARLALEELDTQLGHEAPVHMIGYSQGSTNQLTTLVEHPAIARRVRSVVTLNSAAGGSEVGDLGHELVTAARWGENLCASFKTTWGKATCEFFMSGSPAEFANSLAKSFGLPVDDLAAIQAFIQAEDGVEEAADWISFFGRHADGIYSLSTKAADAFWQSAERGGKLPVDVLYLSFTSIITDEDENLPLSNKLFFDLLERAGGKKPYNDMQVRLDNQRLRAPASAVTVSLPVAEGNHWQWELAPGAVPEATMPREMADRIPHRELMVALYQALHEIGVVQ
jgi:pimeloyl-ACP methyl ester carboxylesterase